VQHGGIYTALAAAVRSASPLSNARC
jgi:hypothetical protein